MTQTLQRRGRGRPKTDPALIRKQLHCTIPVSTQYRLKQLAADLTLSEGDTVALAIDALIDRLDGKYD